MNAQVIPDSLCVDWSTAGYKGDIPEPSTIINVTDHKVTEMEKEMIMKPSKKHFRQPALK